MNENQIINTISLISLSIAAFYIIAAWKVYIKAGQSGWAAIIPIYNIYILMRIIGRPGWWVLLFLIPYVNLAISIVVVIDLAKSFGRSVKFAILGLLLFPFVGYAMLAYGEDKYLGPQGLIKKKATIKKTHKPLARSKK